MSKKIKGILSVLFVLFCSAAAAFAYDGTVFYCEDFGYSSRFDFINEASSSDVEESFASGANSDHSYVDKFFQIDEDSVDEEDVDLINSVPDYLDDNYNISDGSTFMTGVMRGETAYGFDGWVIFSNYNSKKGWLHYLYYFSIVTY